jgi:hypothetical protein
MTPANGLSVCRIKDTSPLADVFPFNKQSPVSGQTARVRHWQTPGCSSLISSPTQKSDFPGDNNLKNSLKDDIAGNLACV